jgi:antitoxin component YwqK of YwqJK toxin-antitoxin module
MEKEMTRVDLQRLEVDDYTYYLDGRPFTGVGYENRPDGTLWGEQAFSIGLPDGPSRTWYENGQLKSETNYKLALADGSSREWYSSGQLKSQTLLELGIALERRKWDETGAVTEQWRIREDSDDFRELQKRRAHEQERVRRLHQELGGASPRPTA